MLYINVIAKILLAPYSENVGRVLFFFASLWTEPQARSNKTNISQYRPNKLESRKVLLLDEKTFLYLLEIFVHSYTYFFRGSELSNFPRPCINALSVLLYAVYCYSNEMYTVFSRFGRRICHGIIMIMVGITFLLVLLVYKGKRS